MADNAPAPAPAAPRMRVTDPMTMPASREEGMDVLRRAEVGDADAAAFVGYTWAVSRDPAIARKGLAYATAAAAADHPVGHYTLGRCAEYGHGAVARDLAAAAAHYQAGLPSGHLGCVWGLYTVARAGHGGGQALVDARDRLMAAVTAADLLDTVAATGSSHNLRDALLEGGRLYAEMLNDYFTALGLFKLGAERGDPRAALEAANLLTRSGVHSGSWDSTLLGGEGAAPDAEAVALYTQVADAPLASSSSSSSAANQLSPDQRAQALAKLGLLHWGADKAAAYGYFTRALAVADEGGVPPPGPAVVYATRCVLRGLGGADASDAALADRLLARGVKLRLGESCVLAAQRQEAAGNRRRAAELWADAARAKMPVALAVTEGLTLAAANARVYGQTMAEAATATGTPDNDREDGAAAAAADGVQAELGHEDAALAVVVERYAHRCDACGKRGTLSSSVAEASGGRLPALRWCGGCSRAMYCCIDCQRGHWREGGHKAECGKGGDDGDDGDA